MPALYARVFLQILDSSLADDWQTRHVFEDILKLTDGDGICDMTRQAIARRTNIPLEIVERAVERLEAPDAHSRDPEHEGRRLLRLDDHRDWGWRVVNWSKYDAIRNRAELRQAKTAMMRQYRERKASLSPTPPIPAQDKDISLEVEGRPTRSLHVDLPVDLQNSPCAAEAAPPAKRLHNLVEEEFLKALETEEAYKGLNVRHIAQKMAVWCKARGLQPTRRRLISWLNREDRPLTTHGHSNSISAQRNQEIGGSDTWDRAEQERHRKQDARTKQLLAFGGAET